MIKNTFEEGRVILIDKPLDWTSFDVVRKIRNTIKIKKVGHAGTLDPLATGLLIVCTGKFTKKINEYMSQEKEYTGTIHLGANTPTYDLESEPMNFKPIDGITDEVIRAMTSQFTGEILQVPPSHSAIKQQGKPVYLLARKGENVVLEPRKITIKSFEITNINLPEVEFKVVCTTGTYIRSLAHDFGAALGCGGYLSSLRRTRIGNFCVEEGKTVEDWVKEFNATRDGIMKTENNLLSKDKENILNMNTRLYNPFEKYEFGRNHCFLTGEKLDEDTAGTLSVFPEWLMVRYSLHDKKIAMLAENFVTYKSLQLPVSEKIIELYINPLQADIRRAFETGYEEVKQLRKDRLFQWISLIVYGMLYHDIEFGIKAKKLKNQDFRLSPLLESKIGSLHGMIQSIIFPMTFEPENPWSIEVVKVNYSQDIFNYKDETKNLNFSLAINGFGIVACLQDSGENSKSQKEVMEKIGDAALHPIQFEELWSRFLYSNYLLRTTSKFKFKLESNGYLVSPDWSEYENGPSFEPWDDNMFAQVLANYWKPWGMTIGDIYSFPDSPISYLINEFNHQFILPESINLPG